MAIRTARLHNWIGVVLALVCIGVCPPAAVAQMLRDDWVDAADQRIEQVRMADARFLVLDRQGRTVQGATIHVVQRRHAFKIGWVLDRQGLPSGEAWGNTLGPAFNSVSLERLTSWRLIEPGQAGELQTRAVDQAVAAVDGSGLDVDWGPVFSADAADLPDGVVPLRGTALHDAAEAYLGALLQRYGHRLSSAVICEQTIHHDRFTPAMLRLLRQRAAMAEPTLRLPLRFDDAFDDATKFAVLSAADLADRQVLGIDGFSLTARVQGDRWRDGFDLALRRLAKLGMPLLIDRLEVGGQTALERSINMETVLRTVFAEQAVSGVVFAGITSDSMADPAAALIDDDAQLTGSGRTLAKMFREVWWTDLKQQTDDLGAANCRVYLGTHDVTATLPDGSQVSTTIRVERGDAPDKQVILQPVVDDLGADQGAPR